MKANSSSANCTKCGAPLAFDAVERLCPDCRLPLLVLDIGIVALWAFADKALASWRGLNGSMFRDLWEMALWAVLMGMTVGWIDYLILRPVWRRNKDHAIQLGARYRVSQTFHGAPAPVTPEISYQGEAPPPECARAFMIPFTRAGRDAYLVINFEVN